MHVLLVEDDSLVAAGVATGLRLHSMTVDHVDNASKARSAVMTAAFDVCVLDLGLPDADGLILLKEWRGGGNSMPVLVLTARDAVEHRVKGLQIGADDYLVKPFDLSELVARLRALVRRAVGRSVDELVFEGIAMQESTGLVTCNGNPVELSRRESTLLHAMLLRPRQIHSVAQLMDSVYGFGLEIGSNVLNVHIHHLRRKLGVDSIETIRGVGYRLGKAGRGASQ